MPTSTPVDIAPARGKLGVMLVGLGAVSTTTIAGVLAIRKNLAKPIGSLTQLATIRADLEGRGLIQTTTRTTNGRSRVLSVPVCEKSESSELSHA